MNYIKDFYYGRFRPSTERFIKNSEYAELLKTVSAMMDEFDKKLSEQDKTDISNIYELQSKLTGISSEENYASGFRDGARLMMDILIGRNENFTGG